MGAAIKLGSLSFEMWFAVESTNERLAILIMKSLSHSGARV